MIANIILLVIVGVLVAIFFFNKEVVSLQSQGAGYMEQMARFLEVELEKESHEDEQVLRVQFELKGHKFAYEHIQQVGLGNTVVDHGCLKIATEDTVSISFSEEAHGSLRSKVSSLEDISKNPWGGATDKLSLPKSLEEFRLLSNDMEKAARILQDDQVVKTFAKFKSRDARGKPAMALEVNSGKVILHFYPNKMLYPNLFEFYSNVHPIEDYAGGLVPLVDRINIVRRESAV